MLLPLQQLCKPGLGLGREAQSEVAVLCRHDFVLFGKLGHPRHELSGQVWEGGYLSIVRVGPPAS